MYAFVLHEARCSSTPSMPGQKAPAYTTDRPDGPLVSPPVKGPGSMPSRCTVVDGVNEVD